jgi:hypothetical protein
MDSEKPDALPGIFINYNIEPLLVRITKHKRRFVEYLTRSFGVIGGVFSVSAIIFRILGKIGKIFN